MSSIYLGRNAAIGVGEESTWGTAVSRGNWRPLISGSLQRTITKTPRPSLLTGPASAMRRGRVVEVDECGGSYSIECTYENIGLFIYLLTGTVAGSTPGPWTYSLASALPSATMEFVRGTGSGEVLEGCVAASGTFAVSAGGVMTYESEVIAQTSVEGGAESPSVAPRSAAVTPSYGTGDTPVLHSHASQLTFNSASYDLIDMSLTLNNGIARRQLLGSAVTAEPLRSDFQSVELSVTVEVQDALYKAMIDDTASDITFNFTSGSLVMAFTVHNAYIMDATDPVSSAGIVTQSITFGGESDGTNEGLAITMTNAVAGDGKDN